MCYGQGPGSFIWITLHSQPETKLRLGVLVRQLPPVRHRQLHTRDVFIDVNVVIQALHDQPESLRVKDFQLQRLAEVVQAIVNLC